MRQHIAQCLGCLSCAEADTVCESLQRRHNLNIARYAATSQQTNEIILLIFYKCSFSKERSVLPKDGRITETCRS
jgi:hypothetical protein